MKIPAEIFFVDGDNFIFKFIWQSNGPGIAQTSFFNGVLTLPDIKAYYKVTLIK